MLIEPSLLLAAAEGAQTFATLGWQAWAVAALVLAMLTAFALNRIGPDIIMIGVVLILLLLGVVTTKEAIRGFASEGVITVALLYVVATGLRETGAMQMLTAGLLDKPMSVRQAQLRIAAPVAFMSAFVNNTPIVAMFMPVVSSVSRRLRIPASRLFMPLSFAAILGGVCTLIGTSTNVVLGDLINKHDWAAVGLPDTSMGMFTITWVGLPIAIVGMLYILVAGPRLLPDRSEKAPSLDASKQYMVAMRVAPGASIIGKTLEGAGLRHLPGLFLANLRRGDEVIHAVEPDRTLREGDVLGFVGILESVVDLQRIKGLAPVSDEGDPSKVRAQMRLTEVVVAPNSPLVGTTIREGGFRSRYGAVVIGVQRAGHAVEGKIGDIVLRPGDTLLLETGPNFVKNHRNTRDFYAVSGLEGAAAPRHDRALIALLVLGVVVALMSFGDVILKSLGFPEGVARNMTEMTAALLGAALMLLMRCCTGPQARADINWQVLIVIACSFALGTAMETTGLAGAIAGGVLGWAQDVGPVFLMAVVYLIALGFTMLLSNNAAAILMFPIVVEACRLHGLNPMPFLIAICVAASCEFSTPIGYQTHLMVMGPGGYKWLDFTRFGLPLNFICMALCVSIASFAYGPLRLPEAAQTPAPSQVGAPSGASAPADSAGPGAAGAASEAAPPTRP